MWIERITRLKKRYIFAVYVLAGSLVIFLSVSWLTFRFADRVERQAQLSTWMLSHFASTYLSQGTNAALNDVLLRTRELITGGGVLAIKGLGGFHLACDATNPRAVATIPALSRSL